MQGQDVLLCLIKNAGLYTITNDNGVVTDLNESYMIMYNECEFDDHFMSIQIGAMKNDGTKIIITDAKANRMWTLGVTNPTYISGPISIAFTVDLADPNSIQLIMQKLAILVLKAGLQLPIQLKQYAISVENLQEDRLCNNIH